VLAATIVAAIDDERVVTRPVPDWNAEGCVAPDALAEDVEDEPLPCVEGASPACVALCRSGRSQACLAAAYTVEHDSAERARPLFALACQAGSPAGCTNFAAGLSSLERDDADGCARSLFERTCEAGEEYACGMLGGMLARGEGGLEDDVRARAVLEADCAIGHSFACAELGLAWHRGDLGDVDDAAALGWLDRACAIDGRACEDARSLRRR
jgi:TPR repeat protein